MNRCSVAEGGDSGFQAQLERVAALADLAREKGITSVECHPDGSFSFSLASTARAAVALAARKRSALDRIFREHRDVFAELAKR